MPSRKTTILVVDDTRLNVQIIKCDLEDEGYNILSSENGKDALKIAEAENPDLILLDIMMPGMDGFEVCKILKEKDNTKDIPIIFLTARNEPEDVVKGFQLGAVDYLRKPFEVSELLVRVKTHVRLKNLQHNLEDMVEERAEELVAAHEELNKILVSSRPYKKPWSVDDAIGLIKKERGKHFDPRLVDLFIENLPKILEIKEKFADSREGEVDVTVE